MESAVTTSKDDDDQQQRASANGSGSQEEGGGGLLRFGGWLRKNARWSPLVLATALLAQRAISGILTKLGHPGASLDDAYIHFQYARAFAEGHPFRFQAGEPISTGATSFLWPLLLAPFYLIGFRDEAILWPAWAMSFVALGALAYEAYALSLPLAGRPAAIGAGAMVLAFGGFAWGAASGMEVVPFAWLLAHGVRRGAEWAEKPETRTRRSLVLMALVAVACPLMRPEGALIALALAAVVALFPRERAVVALGGRDLSRAEALVFVACALAPNLLLLLLTGHPTSSTAQVKLLPGNPYYVLADAAAANARTLVGTILDGQVWSAEFLPKGGAPVACLGLAAIVWRAEATKYRVRGVLVLLLALMMFVPCLYVTFLWNRLRYLWPFATGWFVGLACLARAAQVVAFRVVNAKAAAVTAALVSGAFAGALSVRLEWVLEDAAQSASGIDRQQATLGRWAKANLPADARIGVNDTGAIAYFGDRKTFDVVGLTTPTEGRYWVAGAASRLEHYERVKAAAANGGGLAAGLPTHFIVYPEWMACEPLLGRALTEATVTDATILGGQTMKAVEARWQYLGTGERPWSPSTIISEVHDTLDVADLESEAEHGYQLLGAREGEQIVHESNTPDGNIVLDGARSNRTHDHFFIKLPPNTNNQNRVAILRTDAPAPTTIKMTVGGKPAGTQPLDSGPWQELVFEIPPDTPSGNRIEVDVISEAGSPFASFHYWFGVNNNNNN